MKHTTVKEIFGLQHGEAREISVGGWIRTMRVSKNFGFIELNDGSCFKNLQVVVEQEQLGNYNQITKLSEGSAISVRGTLVPTPQMKQPFELKALEVIVEGESTPDYPMQKKRHTMEYLRTQAHLRPRTNTFGAVFRIRSLAAFAIHEFFNKRGFMYVHTPIITSLDAEGAGEMFQVTTLDVEKAERLPDGAVDYTKDFFGKRASLTVTGQLNVECFAMAFRNVYTFGPTFRAENSFTPRHAAEFWMIEPEIAFADLNDDMDLAEDMLKYILTYVLENAQDELSFLNQFVDKGLLDRLAAVRDASFARATYTEAIAHLEKADRSFDYPVSWGSDIQTEHERYLTEHVYGGPVFVTDYPKDIKAFYMRENDDGKTVAATDLLVPGVGELIGASQREERLDVLVARMKELGLNPEDYWWYLELRKYGSVKHAGFGLGFERLIMYLTGIGNIRDSIPFPRTTKNAEF